MYSRWTSPHVRRFFCFYSSTLSSGVHLSPLGFAACQSKKCTIQARTTPTKQYLRSSYLVGALETSAPP